MNQALETWVPLQFQRRGRRLLASTAEPAHDTTLLKGLGRAFYWQQLIDSGVVSTGSDIAKQEGLQPWMVCRLLRLTLLAPDIIERLIAGQQPRHLNLMWFQRNHLPADWQAQRDIIASFE